VHCRNEVKARQNRQSERDDHNMRQFGFRELAQNIQGD